MTLTTGSGGGGGPPVLGYALAFAGVLLVAFVAWIVRFSQPDLIEQVDAGLAAAVARREAPPTAEIAARSTATEILMTVVGVPSRADQTRLLFAIARSQESEQWMPVAVSFGSYVEIGEPAGGEDDADAESEPVRDLQIDRVVYVSDGQVPTDR